MADGNSHWSGYVDADARLNASLPKKETARKRSLLAFYCDSISYLRLYHGQQLGLQ
jgi:hypothetical protein